MPHVCLVNCLHPPADVRVVQKMGRFLRENGVRVSWVGPGRAADKPAADYGIEYHFYSTAQGRLGRLLRHHRRAFRTAMRIDRADVYVGVEPDSAAAAAKLARERDAKAAFDVHEAYDEMLSQWVLGPARPALSWIVERSLRRICRQSDLVIGVNDMVLAPYRDVPTPKLVLRNCAPRSFAEMPAADVCSSGRSELRVMHGKSIIFNGTVEVLQAMGMVRRAYPDCQVIVFDCLDTGSHTLSRAQFQEIVDREGIGPNVDLRKTIPMTEMPAVLRACDIGLIAYDRTFGVKSLPNRFFEYLAAGLPIIAPDYSEEIAPILRREQCGLLADMENPRAIADAILRLRKDRDMAREMGRRAREAFLARHNFSVEAMPFLEMVRAVSCRSHEPPVPAVAVSAGAVTGGRAMSDMGDSATHSSTPP